MINWRAVWFWLGLVVLCVGLFGSLYTAVGHWIIPVGIGAVILLLVAWNDGD